jgi:hypothetical protein
MGASSEGGAEGNGHEGPCPASGMVIVYPCEF